MSGNDAEYRQKVIAKAWQQTKTSFGWNGKTAAVVLTALGTIAVAGLRGDLSAMNTSAVGYFWIAFAPALAGTVLFIWNVIETQATLYGALRESASSRIQELEAEIERHKKPPPDYEAWKHAEKIDLRTAAFLWCDEAPKLKMSPKVTQWYNALVGAIQKGELEFVPKVTRDYARDAEIASQKRNPNLHTEVTRAQLRVFAKRHGYDPKFLRD